jgi:hypothetical protein
MATSKTVLSLAAVASIALAAVGTARADTDYYKDSHSIVNQSRFPDGSLSCMARVVTTTSGGHADFAFAYGYTAAGYSRPGYFAYGEEGLNWTTGGDIDLGDVTVQVAGNTPFHVFMHTDADHPSRLMTLLAGDTVLSLVYQFNGGPQSLSVTTLAGTRTISLAGSSQAIFTAFSHCLNDSRAQLVPSAKLPPATTAPGAAGSAVPPPVTVTPTAQAARGDGTRRGVDTLSQGGV